MRQSKNLPDYVRRITTYAELSRYAEAFARGCFNLLLLLGGPGLGKSRCFRQALAGSNACWIDGSASPFGIYQAAFQFRNQPVVLDDVDGLYQNRDGVRLLKCLCQSEPKKSLSWRTNATANGSSVPPQFTTSSRVAIIANQWNSLNADVAALEDRGQLLSFEPAAIEVHQHAATWFSDQEILQFIGARLHLLKRPSLRMYINALELKNAGVDWQEDILARIFTGTALIVARLRDDLSFRTEEDRATAFVAMGAGCRATYFNHLRRQRAPGVPHTCGDRPNYPDRVPENLNFTISCGCGIAPVTFPRAD